MPHSLFLSSVRGETSVTQDFDAAYIGMDNVKLVAIRR
jgi:hypothetical protein